MAEPALLVLCAGCGTELSPAMLACPSCHRLVHADELKRTAAEAQAAADAGELSAALTGWRRAQDLLPAGTRQHQQVGQTIASLSRQVESAPASTHGSGAAKVAGPLGALTLILWKFKFAALFVLTKGKLLLLGLTKLPTLFSMLAFLGVYWAAFGWRFALGFVASIYVHEMGHVAALQRLGIKATAPMFVPGLGAFVRLNQYPADAREDARVGLAGPIWGMGAAIACWLAYVATGNRIFAALAATGAVINLFNLIPIWQLDGGRGFRALGRGQRLALTALTVGAALVTGQGWLWILAGVAGVRALIGRPAETSDTRALVEFAVLVVVLAALTRVAPLS